MNFGYMPDTHGGPYDQLPPDSETSADFCEHLIQEAVVAEQSGFQGVFVPERHARTETMWPAPLPALVAMAMRTERIKLGTCVLQPALYNPVHLAEDAALVDLASRGRLILGMGTGYHPGYFSHFGVPYGERLGRFLESIHFLQRAWTKDKFDWDGTYWQMENVLVNPKPYQRPSPPMWFAATAEEPLRRAGRLADGVVLLGFSLLHELRESVDVYREAAEAAGKKPVVALIQDGFVGTDYEHARETFGRLWVEEVLYYIKWGMLPPGYEIQTAEDATLERLEKYMILGDAQQCAEKVRLIHKELNLGPDDWIILRSRLPFGPPFAEALAAIERFGREVLPLTR